MDWKKFGKKLLFPPVWLMVILVVICAAALPFIFLNSMEQTVPAYIAYGLAFYTLSVVCLSCILVLPKQYRAIRDGIYNNPLGNRFMTDRVFRIKLSLSASLAVSMLYAIVHIGSWYLLRSWWFIVLSAYYAIMAVMRFLLVRYVRIQKIGTSILGEWKRSRICACILLLINLSLSGAVLMILYRDMGYDYPGIMIYVMALYTFYAFIHAIVDIVRYRKLGSPVMSTAKIVSLSGALVSMLNLETAMFAQFGGEMTPQNQHLFIILTGAGISITVVTLSVILIVTATKAIRREKHGK
ncbi:MAG: hypothetical protein IIX23_03025 [Oscillospiraceae bacterium]|nr:hypothetical protein [Oscillospiraceae bacterium]